MKKAKSNVVPFVPAPQCPQCTTPSLCGSPAWRDTKGAFCKGKPSGPDDCACINECGDDDWVEKGLARGCPRYYLINQNRTPPVVYPRVVVPASVVAGPFSPLPYDWE